MEEADARRCRARLGHLADIGLPQKDAATLWNDARMDRILADYMLRRGYHRSAVQLGSERQIEVLLCPACTRPPASPVLQDEPPEGRRCVTLHVYEPEVRAPPCSAPLACTIAQKDGKTSPPYYPAAFGSRPAGWEGSSMRLDCKVMMGCSVTFLSKGQVRPLLCPPRPVQALGRAASPHHAECLPGAGAGGRAHLCGRARHPGGPGAARLQRRAGVVRAAPRAPAQAPQQAGVHAAHPGAPARAASCPLPSKPALLHAVSPPLRLLLWGARAMPHPACCPRLQPCCSQSILH